MSRNKVKREKTHKSILAQFFILLVGLGLLCGALFLVLHTTVGSALESYVYSSDFLSNVTEKRVSDLQEYVTENQVSATDSQALSQWMRGKPLTLMEVYRSNVLVYSSYASYSLAVEGGDFTWTATEGEETPTYDWISYYTVDFADGEGEVVLYSNELYRYSTYATMMEIILCAALFLLGFLIAFQRTVSYMRQISLEIQAMEGGDLNRPITVRGDNDLTALAESLDAMRLAFRAQQEREASTYAANQALISQMSHDLRTPLTTLLLYTEIVAGGKYHSQAQLAEYLTKIDTKARQIKQLSDNLFEYALVTRDTVVTLDRPASFSQIFEEALAEFAEQLGQRGYGCLLDLGEEDVVLQVYRPYIRRIFDNIASNILKYADPAHPVQVCFVREGEQAGLAFANVPLPPESGGSESTKVGLVSVQTMMEKMQAEVRVSQTARRFCITLLFHVKPAKTE